MFQEVKPPRPLKNDELAILNKLLSCKFLGVEQLKAQLKSALVSGEYNTSDPTVEFFIPKNLPKAMVKNRVPVEGEYSLSIDGIMLRILLHTEDGYLKELEFYTDDGREITNIPSVDEVQVICSD